MSVFLGSYHGTFFCICLANHSAVSKPHPTEGTEIYTGCGNPRCYKVCFAVCSLCAGRCSLVVLTLFFQRPRAFGEIGKTRASISIRLCTAYDTCVACLGKTQGARDSLCSTGLLPSSHSGVDASVGHAALRGLPLRSVISDQNTTMPPLRLLLLPG